MLVLNREWGEEVIVDGDIIIKVISAVGKRGVRIGIHAPEEVTILRKELIDKGGRKTEDSK